MAKAKAKASDILHVGVVFDRSGSMARVWHGAISGMNDYISQLQGDEDADTTFVTLAAFDDVFEIVQDHCPVGEMPEYDGTEFPPRGSTALNDSIAGMIRHMDGKIGDDKALIVVLTDGFENHSVEFAPDDRRVSTRCEALVQLVKMYEKKGNWTFVYLGANDPDVYETAAGMGIARGATAAYTSSNAGYAAASATLASVTRTRKRSITGQSATPFADAGEDQDLRVEDDILPPPSPPKPEKKGKLDESGLSEFLS